jgi:hypothetical protein
MALETADAGATLAGAPADVSRQARYRPGSGPLGFAPVLALVAAIGVLLVAVGDDAARTGSSLAQPLFWLGLVATYAPIAFRLLSASASRTERIALVALLGGALFLVKVLYSPNSFVFYDELGWWRATHDLLQTGDPFSSNPLVVTTPGFPGLDLFTAPLAQLAKLSIFDAGTIVIGVVRTALMVALFLFLERATRSSRAAGIGVAVYACNPSFLYFNGQFAYESVALLLGLSLLLVTVRWVESAGLAGGRGMRSLIAAMLLLAFTLTVTHHMTSYAIFALLAGWAAFDEFGDNTENAPARESLLDGPALPAILLGLMASAWFLFVAGGVTITELGDVFTGAIRSAVDLVFGGSAPKRPFEAGGQSNTWPERLIAVASVLSLLLVIPLGLRRIWRSSASDSLQRVLALIAVLYVVTLGLRLTHNGTETSQRASEFVFLGLAFLAAMVLKDLSWLRRERARVGMLALAGLATLVFVGGFIVGEPPQGRQPGPFLVSAERRSVSAQGIAAAEFAAAELPPGSRVLVDHANATLIGSYGELDPVTRRVDGISITRVFFDRNLGRPARRVIRNGHIDYLIVDRRLSRTPPVGGYYFTQQEPGAFSRATPISRAALNKFPTVPGLKKIYANGAIAIYDTSGLRFG